MDVTAFKNALVAALVDTDSDIQIWSYQTYGRLMKVFVGVDEDKPPGERDCPYVEIMTEGRLTGPDKNPVEYRFIIICNLYDRDIVKHSSQLVFENAGLDRLETFNGLVLDAFLGVLPNNATVDELELDNSPVESWPLLQCGMRFIVHEPRTIGQRPY